jgi:hypothetical protein
LALKRSEHLAPLGPQHPGKHQGRKSEQGEGGNGREHRRFSFRFALNSSRNSFVPKRVSKSFNLDDVPQMFRNCQASLFYLCSFLAGHRAEVLEFRGVIR